MVGRKKKPEAGYGGGMDSSSPQTQKQHFRTTPFPLVNATLIRTLPAQIRYSGFPIP